MTDLALLGQFVWITAFGWFLGRKLTHSRWAARHRVMTWMLQAVGWFWMFIAVFTGLSILGDLDVRGGLGWLMANVMVLSAFGVIWSVAVLSTLVAWKEVRAYRAQKRSGVAVDDSPLLNVGPREVYEDIRDAVMSRNWRGR